MSRNFILQKKSLNNFEEIKSNSLNKKVNEENQNISISQNQNIQLENNQFLFFNSSLINEKNINQISPFLIMDQNGSRYLQIKLS